MGLSSSSVGQKVVGCCWVYGIKVGPNGEVGHLKARLMTKGHTRTMALITVICFLP